MEINYNLDILDMYGGHPAYHVETEQDDLVEGENTRITFIVKGYFNTDFFKYCDNPLTVSYVDFSCHQAFKMNLVTSSEDETILRHGLSFLSIRDEKGALQFLIAQSDIWDLKEYLFGVDATVSKLEHLPEDFRSYLSPEAFFYSKEGREFHATKASFTLYHSALSLLMAFFDINGVAYRFIMPKLLEGLLQLFKHEPFNVPENVLLEDETVLFMSEKWKKSVDVASRQQSGMTLMKSSDMFCLFDFMFEIKCTELEEELQMMTEIPTPQSNANYH